MKAHKVIEYKKPILEILKRLGGVGTSNEIYKIVINDYITLNEEDLKRIKKKDKSINYTVSRNNFAFALVLLQDCWGRKIERIKFNPKTYKLLI